MRDTLKRGIAVLVLILGACSRTAGGVSHGDTLNAGAAIAPNTFNPLLQTEAIEGDFNRMIFSGLTMENERNVTQPELATIVPTLQNGGISGDGKTITYHLRQGVLWQDGAPFSSADVKFTWHAIMNPKTNVSNRVPYDDVASVDTPNSATVVFHLKQPYAPFVAEAFNSTTIASIVPVHLLQGVRDMNTAAFNSAPVGTGAYRMVKWVRGDRIEFQANDRYFLGAPKIKHIVFHEIPNENTGINELLSHELDWYPYISEASYDVLRQAPNVRIVVTPQNSYRALYINTERPILADVRVRRAIAYAIDKRQLVDKVTHGTGTIAAEDIPSFMWAYDRSIPTNTFDPQSSRRLLDEAGWKPGPDGIREKGGQRLSLLMTLRQGAAGDEAMSVMIQAWLRAVGIETTIKAYPGSTLFALGQVGVLDPGKYDIDISGFTSPADPDDSDEFLCANRPPNGFNWTRYCSPVMDALQSRALKTYDRSRRKAAYAKIEELLAAQVPQVYIYYQPQISAVNPALQNFTPSMVSPSWNINQWTFRR